MVTRPLDGHTASPRALTVTAAALSRRASASGHSIETKYAARGASVSRCESCKAAHTSTARRHVIGQRSPMRCASRCLVMSLDVTILSGRTNGD
jgi:hypothetical protein